MIASWSVVPAASTLAMPLIPSLSAFSIEPSTDTIRVVEELFAA
jgi:hypothetical protein